MREPGSGALRGGVRVSQVLLFRVFRVVAFLLLLSVLGVIAFFLLRRFLGVVAFLHRLFGVFAFLQLFRGNSDGAGGREQRGDECGQQGFHLALLVWTVAFDPVRLAYKMRKLAARGHRTLIYVKLPSGGNLAAPEGFS